MLFKISISLLLLLQGTVASSASASSDGRTYKTMEMSDPFMGRRTVSYYTMNNGLAVMDGDIIYGMESELLAHAVKPNSNEQQKPRALSIRQNMAWPRGNVIYKFDSARSKSLLNRTVDLAIANWLDGAPYLKFTERAPSAVYAANVITISADSSGGCASHVGYGGVNMLGMNLNPNGCLVDEATHEFGHALGLQHEHTRSDRNQHVIFDCTAMDPKCKIMPPNVTCCDVNDIPDGCCPSLHNFDIDPQDDSTGPYDFGSIMHYASDSFAYKGKHTLIPLDAGVTIPETNPSAISALDFGRICKLYDAGNCA